MALKFFILFLSTFLLVQYSLGKPAPADESASENSLDLNEIPGIQLILYVFEHFGSWADDTLKKGIKLMEDVSDEISALENKDEETVARLEEYATIIAKMKEQLKYGELKDFTDKYDTLSHLGIVFETATHNDNPSASAKLFEDSFMKHGFADLAKDFGNGFAQFSTGIIAETHKLLDSDVEIPNKQAFVDFLKEFEADATNEEKFAHFQKFFDLFEEKP